MVAWGLAAAANLDEPNFDWGGSELTKNWRPLLSSTTLAIWAWAGWMQKIRAAKARQECRRVPPPRVFLGKSVYFIDCKGVEFLPCNKERVTVSKDGTCRLRRVLASSKLVTFSKTGGREGVGEKASLVERNEIAVRMRIGAGKVPITYLLISCCKTRPANRLAVDTIRAHGDYNSGSISEGIDCKALFRADVSFPPASAKSGLPPPEPPTCLASCWISLPA